MEYLLILTSLLWLTTVKAGNLPVRGSTTNIQGPSSQSRVMGPDGSVITAEAPGGQIVQEETPGVFGPAGHFLGPASEIINPAVSSLGADKVIDAAIAAPSETIATGKQAAQKAEEGTRSIQKVVKTPSTYIGGVSIEN